MGKPWRKVIGAALALTLAIMMIPAEGLAGKAFAADPVAAFGKTYTESIPEDGARYYTFTMPAAGMVAIGGLAEMYDGDSYDHRLRLCIYDAKGKELWSEKSKIPGTEGERAYLNESCRLGKGTYTLKIAPKWGRGVKCSFTLSFENAQESFTENQGGSNNSFETASDIVLNRTYRSQLGWDDPSDYYRFTLSRKQNVRIIFNTHSDKWPGIIALYDRNHAKVKEWSWTSEIDGEAMELAAGTYYLRIDRPRRTTGLHSFQIADPLPISQAAIKLSQTRYDYTGTSRQPAVTVTWGGTQLRQGRDFEVSYGKNKSAGTGKVVVKGKGTYAGSATKTFTIRPRKASVKSLKAVKGGFKVTARKKSKAEASGFQVQYSTKKSMKGAKTKTFKSSKTIKGLKKGKRYYVRVRAYKTVGKTKVYSAWSSRIKVTTKKR